MQEQAVFVLTRPDAVPQENLPPQLGVADLVSNELLPAATGLLSWTPTYDQAGVYDAIVVIASDGLRTVSQHFSITVEQAWAKPVLATVALAVQGKRVSQKREINEEKAGGSGSRKGRLIHSRLVILPALAWVYALGYQLAGGVSGVFGFLQAHSREQAKG